MSETDPTAATAAAATATAATPAGLSEADRKALTADLSAISVDIASELRERMLKEPDVRARAEALHADEKVGEDFEVWTDLLSRRAAVLWVLKSVYVRVLEDRGLLSPRRLVDATSQELFRRLAPDLGDTAYLTWVYRDLARPEGGLPELFSPQPAEIVPPSDASSRALMALWNRRDPDTGALHYRFDQERFDGRLMGDLYQDLDPVVKDRFALLQTPDFVLEFILDETLTPAIAEFGIDEVRVLDPACGSGHFLLEAFRRLVAGMREAHPERELDAIVRDVLSRVVGIDLNDYACALARARLVMTALETLGTPDLAAASELHPQVFWADGLEQVEREEPTQGAFDFAAEEETALRATLTQPEVRDALRPILKRGFHCVMGNPPYITEKDKARKAYHREKVGKRRRYESASGKYSLGAVFTQRMFEVAVSGGFLGEITSNSFMKRQAGKGLIEKVLPRFALTKIVDTSGAYIPGHGTPTVLIFGRHQTPASTSPAYAIMGKRGEPGKPGNPAQGSVWTSIVKARTDSSYEDEFVSVSHLSRETLNTHPWSVGGGGATELAASIEEGSRRLGATADSIGITAFTLEDDAFVRPKSCWVRLGCSPAWRRAMVEGELVRDWAVHIPDEAYFPYDLNIAVEADLGPERSRLMWPWRARLERNLLFGSKTKLEGGLRWYEFGRLTAHKLKVPLSITFAFKATHNHFALDRGGKVFNRTAPVVKLPPDATEDDHLVLLAQLNSSTACFWLKQVCQTTGGPGGGKTSANDYENFYEIDGSKLKGMPLAAEANGRLVDLARALDETATLRRDDSPGRALSEGSAGGSAGVQAALRGRRERDLQRLAQMAALQEELDWLCYRLYGVDPDAPEDELRLDPEAIPPLTPGQRPFELTLARDNAPRWEAVARGEEPDEQPTAWFERHGWDPVTDLADIPEAWRSVTEARLARTAASRELSLLEQPTYKRRWYRPDYEKEGREAMALWLADRVEEVVEAQTAPFTVRTVAAKLQDDAAFEAVATLYAGKGFDLDALVGSILDEDSVPNLKVHVFKPKGLVKRAAWERCWKVQHAEDAWDAKKKARDEALEAGVAPEDAPPKPEGPRPEPEVPPKYGSGDFLKTTYWKQRGKLDVPKERFIAYTEAPGALTQGGEAPLYGWAGWDPFRRAQVLLSLDEHAEELGVPLEDRYGLLWGAQFQLPYIRWDDDKRGAADEFEAVLQDLVGTAGVTDAMLTDWAERHPPPKKRRGRRKKSKRSK